MRRQSERTRCKYDDYLYEKIAWAEAKGREAPILRSLALCMNYSQTLYAFAMLEMIGWPKESWDLLSWTKLITMDMEFFKPDCIVPLPFFTKWIGKLVMPYVMTVLLVIITVFTMREVKKKQAKEASG